MRRFGIFVFLFLSISMFATTTAVNVFLGASSDVGYMLSLVVAVVVGGAIALMGLGFGMHKIREWVTYDEHGWEMHGGMYARPPRNRDFNA